MKQKKSSSEECGVRKTTVYNDPESDRGSFSRILIGGIWFRLVLELIYHNFVLEALIKIDYIPYKPI